MSVSPLSGAERSAALDDLPEWTLRADRLAIERAFHFKSFVQAFAFMTKVALIAEKQGHHPEWTNVYDRVDITLTTHEAGGLSERDIRMARAIDRLL